MKATRKMVASLMARLRKKPNNVAVKRLLEEVMESKKNAIAAQNEWFVCIPYPTQVHTRAWSAKSQKLNKYSFTELEIKDIVARRIKRQREFRDKAQRQ